ncbi:hypothetical protein C2U70_14915 [Bradyrhizobium guangdongense]|nr:hypothetical protein C2U70_14915 [Bradyrhizobium guangdongense]
MATDMDPIRRHLLKAAGLFVATRAFANDQQGANMQPPRTIASSRSRGSRTTARAISSSIRMGS